MHCKITWQPKHRSRLDGGRLRAAAAALAVSLTLILASTAGAGDANCITLCREKTERCGVRCEELSGQSFHECELRCAKSFFADCVGQCQQTGEVVMDDYRVIVPETPVEAEAGPEERGVPEVAEDVVVVEDGDEAGSPEEE